MRFDREKNAKRNILIGTLQKVVSLILPFVLRTTIIYSIGVEYAGINTLFASLLNVLSIAELGVGSAVIYSMYEPIANNDVNMVCALLNYYKKCYRIIGSIILGIGLLLIPLIPVLIRSDIPNGLNIYIAYIISLISTCVSYFLFAHKTSLLVAMQRQDIVSWVFLFSTILQYVLQIWVVTVYKNYYGMLLIVPICNVINNLLVEKITRTKYSEYIANGHLDIGSRRSIRKKINSLFVYKIGITVSNSADNIVISIFLGLPVLAMYGNYYYVITALFGFLGVYYDSVCAGIGNKMVLEDRKKVFVLFQQMFFLQGIVIGWMATCMLCLYQDFMYMWLHDKSLMLDNKIVLLLVLYFYTWKINDISAVFKEAAGIWEYDRYRPLFASFCNLITNIILVKYIGLYGIILSTILCEITFSLFWGGNVLYKYYFKENFLYYFFSLIKYTVVTVCVCGITFMVCSLVTVSGNIGGFVFKIIICVWVPGILYSMVYFRNPLLWDNIERLQRIIKK